MTIALFRGPKSLKGINVVHCGLRLENVTTKMKLFVTKKDLHSLYSLADRIYPNSRSLIKTIFDETTAEERLFAAKFFLYLLETIRDCWPWQTKCIDKTYKWEKGRC